MKLFTIKRIIMLILIVGIGTVLGLYFIGGLNSTLPTYDNVPFDTTGFINFNTIQYDEEGNRITDLNLEFDNQKVVAENDDYVMLFDEATTIARVIKKDTCTALDYSDCEVVYQTALDDTSSAKGANILVNYVQKSNGKAIATPLDSMLYSVQFENSLTGEKERHYQVKYVDNGVQILYEIGKFSANLDYFPAKLQIADYNEEGKTEEELEAQRLYNLQTMEGRFRGNTTFETKQLSTNNYVLEYTGVGYTYSQAAATYIEENLLATVIPRSGYWELRDIDPAFIGSYGTHLNSPTSPCTNNPFFSKQEFAAMMSYYQKIMQSATVPTTHYNLKLSSSSQQVSLYRMLYTEHDEKDIATNLITILDIEGNPITRGGYHAVDEEGNYLYDEEGKPIQALYTLEQTAIDNAIFGIESVTSLARFQVVLQFVLNNDRLEATILSESLQDSSAGAIDSNYNHDYIMSSIQVLPQLTTSYDVAGEGMMVIPDGSGAVIQFNNQKAILNYSPYSKSVYGVDRAFVQKRAPEDVEELMFGMFGFLDITGKKGVMAVVEKGAAQSALYADTPRAANQFNTIYYTSIVRQSEMVTAGTGWNTSDFPKWTEGLIPFDLQYNFVFLEEEDLGYVELAQKYREYLIDRYNLTPKDTTTSNLVDLNVLGSFERYALFMGIRYMTDDTLTTFDQAQTILTELLSEGVDTMNLSYLSWTRDAMEYNISNRLRVSRVLGRAQGMMALNTFAESNGVLFFPEIFVATTKGYDLPFGQMKYTTKGVGNDLAIQYPFNLATLMPDRRQAPTYFVAPSFYSAITDKILASYQSLNIKGAYLSDLGNLRVGDYDKNKETFPYAATLLQQQILAEFQTQVQNIKLSSPFDYAFPYVTTAVSVPVTSSAYGIFDATIPFYQLVVSGLFDYTTVEVNGTSDKSVDWFLVKALETGSNLQFLLSYEDPKILLETNYTQYYKSYYANWKDTIISMNETINELGIHGGQLIKHELVTKDVVEVEYSNGVKLILNTGNIAYDYLGTMISAYGYLKIGGS